jgi:hypothetical protein
MKADTNLILYKISSCTLFALHLPAAFRTIITSRFIFSNTPQAFASCLPVKRPTNFLI